MATGNIFSKTTQALFYNYKQLPIQRMLDFDFLCGMYHPSKLLTTPRFNHVVFGLSLFFLVLKLRLVG